MAWLLSGAVYVRNLDAQDRIFDLRLNICDLNQITENLLQRALNRQLHRSRHRVASRGEYELQGTAAKSRPVHSLARGRE